MGKNHVALAVTGVTAASIGFLVALYVQKKAANDEDKKWAVPEEFIGSPYEKEVRLAMKWAKIAGTKMTKQLDTKATSAETDDLGILTKGKDIDFATVIDLENEELITKGIQENFPDHQIIGEESTESFGTGVVAPMQKDTRTWIIDPVDGTTNFASAIPLCCVSIGMCDAGVPVMGVVYAPATGEVYLGIKGKGAYRNGERISLKKAQDEKRPLSNSIVCFEFGYARSEDAIKKMLGAVERIMRNGCRTTRSLGSGVLDLCYVATGRLDVVYTGLADEGWKPWDFCAGMVFVQEAGGVIEDLWQEGTFDLYKRDMICAVSQDLLNETRKVVIGKK
mmetsp:Transcript_14432/g.22002  ORF Transcript_14432/g.22002 Transcript_14432/m.22002 type:complete len:336 (+) Transcript_14432:46-1053(+)